MIEKIIKLYTFDELNDKAKQCAIEKMRDINVDYKWWEYIYSGWEERGVKVNGFDIDRHDAKIEFLDSINGVLGKIINDGYLDTEGRFLAMQKEMGNADSLYDECEIGPIKHEEMMDDIMTELKAELEHIILKSLRDEYEWLTSEDQIKESIIANELLFHEDGKPE